MINLTHQKQNTILQQHLINRHLTITLHTRTARRHDPRLMPLNQRFRFTCSMTQPRAQKWQYVSHHVCFLAIMAYSLPIDQYYPQP